MAAQATKTSAKKSAASNTSTRSNRTGDPLEAIAISTERAAIALETIAGLLSCAIEVVDSEKPGGVSRCVFRTYEREFEPSYG